MHVALVADEGRTPAARGGSRTLRRAHGIELTLNRYRPMPRYFFDTRDGDLFVKGDDGSELADLNAGKKVAALSLIELARDVVPASDRRVLIVEVRDERRPLLETRLTFEATLLVDD